MDGGEKLASGSEHLILEVKSSDILWGGGWVVPSAGLDEMGKVKVLPVTKKKIVPRSGPVFCADISRDIYT